MVSLRSFFGLLILAVASWTVGFIQRGIIFEAKEGCVTATTKPHPKQSPSLPPPSGCSFSKAQVLQKDQTLQQLMEYFNLKKKQQQQQPFDCKNFTYRFAGSVILDSDGVCGGCMVLGSLVNRLRKGGCQVVFDDSSDPNRTIIIYPEVIAGNPFRGRRIAHWLLFFPGGLGWKFQVDPRELLLTFGWDVYNAVGAPAGYKRPDLPTPFVMNLHLANYQLNWLLEGDKIEGRLGSFYMIYKGGSYWSKAELDEAIRNLDKGQPEEGSGISPVQFNVTGVRSFCTLARTKRIFYSFDPHSFYSVLAVSCGGCISVVLTPSQKTIHHDDGVYGIKHGIAWSRDEIPKAAAERQLLIKEIKCFEDYADVAVRWFVEKTQNWDAFFDVLPEMPPEVECAKNAGRCCVPYATSVGYGLGHSNEIRKDSPLGGWMNCTHTFFGGDPAPYSAKTCRFLVVENPPNMSHSNHLNTLKCADRGQTCSIPYPTVVSLVGRNIIHSSKLFSKSPRCEPLVFGLSDVFPNDNLTCHRVECLTSETLI